MKTLALHAKGQKRLGDKVEYFYTLEETESSVANLVDALREFESKEGKSIHELTEPDNEDQVTQEYEAIRRYLGVCAGKSQKDVWGFIRLLLTLLEKRS